MGKYGQRSADFRFPCGHSGDESMFAYDRLPRTLKNAAGEAASSFCCACIEREWLRFKALGDPYIENRLAVHLRQLDMTFDPRRHFRD